MGKPQLYLTATAILSFSSIQLHFFSPSRQGKRMPSKLPLFSATRRPCRSLVPSFRPSFCPSGGAASAMARVNINFEKVTTCAARKGAL